MFQLRTIFNIPVCEKASQCCMFSLDIRGCKTEHLFTKINYLNNQ